MKDIKLKDTLQGIFVFITLMGIILATDVYGGVKMTVTFWDGKQVVRQFEDFDEMLLTFQQRESCAVGVVDIHIEKTHIEGLDDE